MTQLTLDTRTLEPETARQLMEGALVWIDANRLAWQRLFVDRALADSGAGRRVNVKRYIEDARESRMFMTPTGSPLKLKNAWSAPFGRLIAAWHPSTAPHITLHASKVDGSVLPPRPY